MSSPSNPPTQSMNARRAGPRGDGSGPTGGRPEAARAVWRWQEADPAGPGRESRGADRDRREGSVRSLLGGAVGILFFFLGHALLATIVWGISGFTLLAALLSPRHVYRWIQTGVGFLALGIGWILSWILLPLFFYGFCFLFGQLARRGNRDLLERRFEDAVPSYWKERKDSPRTRAFYERQF